MKLDRRLVATTLFAAALPAAAATPPSGMMANVYRLTEASAVLSICFESAEFRALPSDRATGLKDLSARLGDLVQGIAGHYRDDSLFVTYENTRARIAADGKLKLQVKQMYAYCGDKLAADMEKYVVENEALIGGFLKRQRSK